MKYKNLKKENPGLLGFIGYKAGMKSGFVQDSTKDSLSKGKRIIVPITIIECPPMKILSIRLYKNKKVAKDILNDNLDKEIKKKIKIPKKIETPKKIEQIKPEEYDDITIIAYTQAKKTNIKKKPDITEIGLTGTLTEKLQYIKDNLKKEIRIQDAFQEGVVDIRGVTKGKGTQGPTKRFGLSLRDHKSEKGRRGPGSGGPWHPTKVNFRIPMAGQMGYFNRVVYNNKIIEINNVAEKDINPEHGFKKYGKIKTDYIILFGSVQGPVKRPIIITTPLRPSKKQIKKNFELISIR